MKRVLTAVAVLALTSLLAGPAAAQGRGWHHGRHYQHHHGGGGGGFIGGIIGGVIGGAIIGSQRADPYYRGGDWAIQECMRRYRSYNPETGIWIDFSGRPRRCP